MIPGDLNLPAKFTDFRPNQLDIAIQIASGVERFSLLSAPTGSGKSLIYMTVAKLLDARVLVLTSTKVLQDQLVADFNEASDLRGRDNYRCLALDKDGELFGYGKVGSSCQAGPCRIDVKCSLKEKGCFYFDARAQGSVARVVVTNYAYWIAMGKYSDPTGLGKFDLLVLDEAHNAQDWVSKFCEVSIGRAEVKRLLGVTLPTEVIDKDWIHKSLDLARSEYRELKRTDPRNTTLLLRLFNLRRDLSTLLKLDGEWIVDTSANSHTFSPLWGTEYAEKYSFRDIDKIILSSATLSRLSSKYLGMKEGEYAYYEIESGFSPGRAPFIYVYDSQRVDRGMGEGNIKLWIRRIDRVIEGRLDRKGIIHPRSYARARDIVSRSKYSGIMLTHNSSRGVKRVVERFKRASPPCVLVSPSVEEGFDFPDDECRYQIIAKVPFLDARDLVTKARMKDDKQYGYYVVSQSIVQMAGRGMRSSSDWCETFILDDHWKWFRKKGDFPIWFRRLWRFEKRVPDPINY